VPYEFFQSTPLSNYHLSSSRVLIVVNASRTLTTLLYKSPKSSYFGPRHHRWFFYYRVFHWIHREGDVSLFIPYEFANKSDLETKSFAECTS
jgi:hypothetical protein